MVLVVGVCVGLLGICVRFVVLLGILFAGFGVGVY